MSRYSCARSAAGSRSRTSAVTPMTAARTLLKSCTTVAASSPATCMRCRRNSFASSRRRASASSSDAAAAWQQASASSDIDPVRRLPTVSVPPRKGMRAPLASPPARSAAGSAPERPGTPRPQFDLVGRPSVVAGRLRGRPQRRVTGEHGRVSGVWSSSDRQAGVGVGGAQFQAGVIDAEPAAGPSVDEQRHGIVQRSVVTGERDAAHCSQQPGDRARRRCERRRRRPGRSVARRSRTLCRCVRRPMLASPCPRPSSFAVVYETDGAPEAPDTGSS